MKNRAFITIAAVGIHICIGSVYAWSVLAKPIMSTLNVSLKDVQWAFSLAILFLGLSAAFLGKYVEKYGPRKTGLASALLFTTGLFGTGLAIWFKSLYMLYFFYGIIGGIGLGIGYICPVSTLVKWFPEKRGFATGCAIMGFGFASLIAGPIIQILIEAYGLINCFFVLGAAYLLIMIPSALYLAPPKNINESTVLMGDRCPITGVKNKTVHEALKTWQFYALWWMLFTNITCGIGLLSVASPMAQEVVKMSPLAAAAMVGIIGLVNGFGRLVWASISDMIGRANTFISFFIIQVIAFVLVAETTESHLFQILIFVIISCYGGGFATIPAFLSDLYGTKHLGAIHGKILTAWAAAGIVGPLFVAAVKETTNSYNYTLFIFAACFIVALIPAVILRVKQPKKALCSECEPQADI